MRTAHLASYFGYWALRLLSGLNNVSYVDQVVCLTFFLMSDNQFNFFARFSFSRGVPGETPCTDYSILDVDYNCRDDVCRRLVPFLHGTRVRLPQLLPCVKKRKKKTTSTTTENKN